MFTECRQLIRYFLCLIIMLLIILMNGCQEGDPVSLRSVIGDGQNDQGDGEANWKTGQQTTYPINSAGTTTIEDSVSGCTIVLPPCENQTLAVSPIVAGPSLDFPATNKFHLEFSGGNQVILKIPIGNNEENALFCYKTLENAVVDYGQGFTDWFEEIPIEEKDGYSVYNVTLSSTSMAKMVEYAAPKYDFFAVSKNNKDTPLPQKAEYFRETIWQCINLWIDTLPSGLKERAQAARLDLLWIRRWSNDYTYYQHYQNRINNAVFYFTKNADLDAISHEVGHYMTHVLLGYNGYNEIFNRFPKDWKGTNIDHNLGDYRPGRLEILEDYAFISQYMITGHVDNHDFTGSTSVNGLRIIFDGRDPSVVDFPSQEGFGAAILLSLVRTQDQIYTFSKVAGWDKARVPVVGANIGDVLAILARGPRNVNECLTMIQDYLDGRSADQFKLSAMLEPLGWSYHGTGTIVDDEGAPASGVEVQSIYQTGEATYRTTQREITDTNGRYSLNRIFPGSSIIRVFYNAGKDSSDFPLNIEYTRPTNETVEISQLTIQTKSVDYPFKISDYHEVLSVGLDAGSNDVTISIDGNLKCSPTVLPTINPASLPIDIQAFANVGDKMSLSASTSYTLSKGTQWTTELGIHWTGAKLVETILANPRLTIDEMYGGSSYSATQSAEHLNLTMPVVTEQAISYLGWIRLEWDYENRYLSSSGATVKTDTGTCSFGIINIFRTWDAP